MEGDDLIPCFAFCAIIAAISREAGGRKAATDERGHGDEDSRT